MIEIRRDRFIKRNRGSLKSNVGHNFLHSKSDLFCGVSDLRQVLRWIEVAEMLDTIISLAVCAALLVYLVYAMLRPEKF
jgi:K+-transporting ATPase KdpF subunit